MQEDVLCFLFGFVEFHFKDHDNYLCKILILSCTSFICCSYKLKIFLVLGHTPPSLFLIPTGSGE